MDVTYVKNVSKQDLTLRFPDPEVSGFYSKSLNAPTAAD